MFRNFKVLLIVLTAIVVAGSAYAFAAAITGIPASKAGEGVGEVTGYVASDVAYTLNATDPSKIDSVSFTLDSTATVVKIKLVTAGTDWYACTNEVNAWTCDTDATPGPQATVATMTGITIVATDQ